MLSCDKQGGIGDGYLGYIDEIAAIRDFLLQCKGYLSQGKFDFVQRSDSVAQLIALELEVADIPPIILELTPDHYVEGPKNDHDADRGGFVYVFGHAIEKVELYIKLKCDPMRGCVCISFHEAKYPLKYPLRRR